MTIAVKPVREGSRTATTPYLRSRDAAGAIEFYKRAFGAEESLRLMDPDGKVGHAEIRIGDARIMLSDEYPEIGVLGPRPLDGSPVMIHLEVEDVDALARRAVAAGATLTRSVKDAFYGMRSGQLMDPFGHVWDIGTRIEETPPEQLWERAAALFGEC